MAPQGRRDVLKTIAGTGTLLAAGTTAASAAPGGRSGASGDQTIVDIAAASDDFDILVAALQETGLDEVLASEDDQFTVFAPTDAAFADLLEALDATPEELLARDDLAQILLYHVTDGRRYARSITNPAPVETLNGASITTDGTTLNGGGLGGAEIVATDIEAQNGVIHVIDGVLLP